MATTTTACTFFNEDDGDQKDSVRKEDVFKKYNEDMDAFIKKKFALQHNPKAHPCGNTCPKGHKCPLIGLPNDTCIYYLRNKCKFDKCKKTHYDEYAQIYQQAKKEFKKFINTQQEQFTKIIELDKEWLDAKTRVCPTCVIPVEKLDGCPSMSCPKCHTTFNWEQMKPATGAKNIYRFEQAIKRFQQPLPDGLPSDKIVLFVSTMEGKTLTFIVPLLAKIEFLMEKISERLNIPIAIQRLLYAGKQLEPAAIINEYDMRNNSTVNLVFRLPGGTTNHFNIS